MNKILSPHKGFGKIIIIILLELFLTVQFSYATGETSCRRIKGAGLIQPGAVGLPATPGADQLQAFFASLGITPEMLVTGGINLSELQGQLAENVRILGQTPEGVPTEVEVKIADGRLIIKQQPDSSYAISAVFSDGISYAVQGDVISFSKDNSSVTLSPTTITQIDENTVSSVEYTADSFPHFSDPASLGQYLSSTDPNDDGLNFLDDIDFATYVVGENGMGFTYILSFDEDTSMLTSTFLPGKATYDAIRAMTAAGMSPEDAIKTVMNSPATPEQGGATSSSFVDKSKRGWFLQIASTILAAAQAGVSTWAFFSILPTDTFSTVTSYLLAAVTGALFYSMFKPAALRTVKAATLPFLNTKEIYDEYREDEVVLTQGLQKPLMICTPFRAGNQGAIEELRKNWERTIQNNIGDIQAGLMNGKLHMVLLTSTEKPELRAAEKAMVEDFSRRYGQWINFSYAHRNEVQQDVGWKWLRLLLWEDYVVNGQLNPRSYIEEAAGKYRIPADQPSFDEIIHFGRTFAPGEIDDFIFLDQANNIAGPHSPGEHGDLLRWAAKVSWSDQNMLDAQGKPIYDMFVPRLQIDPDKAHNLMEKLMIADDEQNLGILLAENWYYNYFSSGGKMWVKGGEHVGRFLGTIEAGTKTPLIKLIERITGKTIDRAEYGNMLLPVMTSHDRWEAFISNCARFLDIIVNETRPDTIPGLVDQASRFTYGDLTEWWHKYFPQSPIGKAVRGLLGLGPVSVPERTRVDQLEMRQAPLEYVFSDPRFAAFLGFMVYLATKPGYMDLQHQLPALIVGATVALGEHMLIPKLIVPIVTQLKESEIWPRLEDSFANFDLGDMAKAIGEGLGIAGYNTFVRFPLSIVGDWMVYMPWVLMKPYLLAKNLIRHKLFQEFVQEKPTGWTKPVRIEIVKGELEKAIKALREKGEWHTLLDKGFSNLVIPLLGAGYTYMLYDMIGPQWMWIGLPLFASWMLWDITSNWIFNRPSK